MGVGVGVFWFVPLVFASFCCCFVFSVYCCCLSPYLLFLHRSVYVYGHTMVCSHTIYHWSGGLLQENILNSKFRSKSRAVSPSLLLPTVSVSRHGLPVPTTPYGRGGRHGLPVPTTPYGLCGRHGLPVPTTPYGLCGRKSSLYLN